MTPPGLGPVTIVGSVVARQIARRLTGGDEVVGGDPGIGVRHVDVDDRGPGGAEGGKRFLDSMGHLRVETGPEVGRHPSDPHTLQRPIEIGAIRRHRRLQRRRVTGVVAGDRLEQQRAVGGGAGHRADLIEARGEGHQPAAADAAIGRFQPRDPAQPRRLADRAARVGADRHRRHVGRHACRRAATGAPRGAGQVPGIVDRAEGGVLVRSPHGKFVHVRLADDDGVGGPQPRHHLGVIRGAEAGEHLRGAGCRLVERAQRVLDGHGKPGQGAERLASLPLLVDRGGGAEGPFPVDRKESIDLAVEPFDPLEEGLGGSQGRQIALADGGDQVDG